MGLLSYQSISIYGRTKKLFGKGLTRWKNVWPVIGQTICLLLSIVG